jgi:hypothetical protein
MTSRRLARALRDIARGASASPSSRARAPTTTTTTTMRMMLRDRAIHGTASSRAEPIPEERGATTAKGARRDAQPRATTTLTEREILAAQKDPSEYLAVPSHRIRNFSIIAHVDHGKVRSSSHWVPYDRVRVVNADP